MKESSFIIIFFIFDIVQGNLISEDIQSLYNIKEHEELINSNPFIINGAPAISGQFPWQASLTTDSSFCGGSLISDSWVLTVAHCLQNHTSFLVRVGTIDINSNGQTFRSTAKFLHPFYYSALLLNDIGLIRLGIPFKFGAYVSEIQLPSSTSGYFIGYTGRVSGWGGDGNSTVLNYTDLEIVDASVCLATYPIFDDSQICAIGRHYESICTGDAGGAMAIQEENGLWTQVGIASFGSSYGCYNGMPQGFTRVTSFLDWISTLTNISID